MSVDDLVREWALRAGSSDRLRANERLIRFLGEWLFPDYQPFPEKADFWARLFVWLDHIGPCDTRSDDQRAMFDFVLHLLFAAERDLTSMYRAAYDGPIRRWLIDQGGLLLDNANLNAELDQLRRDTWFGSLAGMDVGGFCRVNRIFPQSYRPEFRFIAEFCKPAQIKKWLQSEGYKRIVVVEDMVGTGEQFEEALPALRGVGGKEEPIQVLFVPLFIPPAGFEFVCEQLEKPGNRHITCQPMVILPESVLIRRDAHAGESEDVARFRAVILRHGDADFGFGDKYGTLALSYLNCPDNVPRIIHSPAATALFPRASREDG
jgi:hypothetical protein